MVVGLGVKVIGSVGHTHSQDLKNTRRKRRKSLNDLKGPRLEETVRGARKQEESEVEQRERRRELGRRKRRLTEIC